MRQPLLAKAPLRLAIAEQISYPPPVGGWNARDAYSAMGPEDAVILQNWFPGTSAVVTRGGTSSHATGIPGVGKTLATYSAMNGAQSMFTATSANIYDVTSPGAVGAGKLARTDGKHQWVNYGDGTNNWLIMVNGVDKPAYFDGTTWTAVDAVSVPALTGVTSSTLVDVMVYQGRVFFIQKNTLSFWYLPSGVVGGALTKFDLSTEASKGGYLMAMMNWTYDGGDGSDDRAVFITSMGEVIVYQGNNPSSSTAWAKVGTYYVGNPIGRRSMCKYGGDLLVLTQEGVVPLSTALTGVVNDSKFNLSNKIDGAFLDASLTYGSVFGWEMTIYPAEGALIVNVPHAENGTHEQFVMNTITKAWCRFTGWDAEAFGILNQELYFVNINGVTKAWTGTTELGNPIAFIIAETAFSRFKSYNQKTIKMTRPVINAAGVATVSLGIITDFADPPPSISSVYNLTVGINNDWRSPPSYSCTWAAAYVFITSTSFALQWLSNDWLWESGSSL